jgi:hypothetical protein
MVFVSIGCLHPTQQPADERIQFLERRANLLNIQGMQAASIHAAMFMQLLAAQEAGNEKLADFYAQRFPPDCAESVRCLAGAKAF